MQKIVTMLVVLLSVSFLALAFAKGPEKLYKATVDSDGVQRVEIVGDSYNFNPNHIIVKVNVPVELKVKKAGGMTPHNIVMKAPEAGIEFEVSLKEDPKVINFTPKKTGTYQFYCSKKLLFFESHREKGMEGVLEVIE